MAQRQYTSRCAVPSPALSITCRSSGLTSANHGSGIVQVAEMTCTDAAPSAEMTSLAWPRARSASTLSAAVRSTPMVVDRKPTRAAAALGRRSSGHTSGPGPTVAVSLDGTSAASSTRTSSAALGAALPSANSPGSSRAGRDTCDLSHSSCSRSPTAERVRAWLLTRLRSAVHQRSVKSRQRLVHPQVADERTRHSGSMSRRVSRRDGMCTSRRRTPCHVAPNPIGTVR